MNIERIVSRNSLQHNRRIANGRSQWPNMIERPRKRNHAPRRNPSISRLDPHASAKRCRFADRARRIGPNRRVAKPRCNRRRRSSGRSSRNMRRIPADCEHRRRSLPANSRHKRTRADYSCPESPRQPAATAAPPPHLRPARDSGKARWPPWCACPPYRSDLSTQSESRAAARAIPHAKFPSPQPAPPPAQIRHSL